jgi:nucleotide-binding universal stress UspA family protein
VSHEAVPAGEFELGTDGPSAILVGMDDTVTATHAFAYAAGLARRQHARLIVIYVESVSGPGLAAPGGAALLVAETAAREEIAASLRERTEQTGKELGITVTFIAQVGDPFTEIKRVANETRADAIVVGASAKAGHKLVGSLAVRLVRQGKWPVTVVP